jgi:putative DNA primase/helicase
MIPIIRESIKVFTRAAADTFDSQRLGDQYGALLGGAWSLMSDDVATRDDAYRLIEQNQWESYAQSTEMPDEKRCIQVIMEHQLRVEADKIVTRTIGELVEVALMHTADPVVTPSLAEAVIGRHGIKADAGCVLVSNTATAIATILSGTAWSSCWATVLARLPGATRPGVTRFRGLPGASRAVSIPLDAL